MNRINRNNIGNLKLLLAVCSICVSFNAAATHTLGGLTYKSLGNNQYYVEMSIMESCQGVHFNNPVKTIHSSCTSNTTLGVGVDTLLATPYVAGLHPFDNELHTILAHNNEVGVELAALCSQILNPSVLPNSRCRGNGAGALSNIKLKYSKIITLSPCDSWEIGMYVAIRGGYTNLTSAQFYTEMFINSLDFPNNSGPLFNDEYKTTVSACIGQKISLSYGAIDPDLDSLRFELTCAKVDTNTCANYAVNYSAQSPIPGAVLDSATGLFSCLPTASGTYYIAYWVKEFDRCGILKAKTQREVRIEVGVCNNTLPRVVSAFTNPTGKVTRDTNGVVCIEKGSAVSWEETIVDINASDSLVVNSNIAAALPGATYTIVPTVNNDSVIVRYNWKPTNLSVKNYNYATIFHDNYCQNIGQSASAAQVKVIGQRGGITTRKNTRSGTNDTLWYCIGDTVELTAVGATNYSWQSISGAVLQTGSNWFPDTNPGIDTNGTGKFVVSQTTVIELTLGNYDRFCGGLAPINLLKDTIVIWANDSFSVSNILDSAFCLSENNWLEVPISKPAGNYSYKWSPSFYLDSNNVVNPNLIGLKTDQDFYVTVTSDSGCARIGKVEVKAAPLFPRGWSIHQAGNFICAGDTVNLNLNSGEIDYGNCEISSVPCSGIPQHVNVGSSLLNSNSTGLNQPIVYSATQKSGKIQLLYKKSTLANFNLTKGLLTSIAFSIDQLPSVNTTFTDFTIRMGCSGTNDLVNYALDTLYEVYSTQSFTPVLGWNVHQFNNDFAWDGQSNIVVEICWTNDTVRNSHPVLQLFDPQYIASKYFTSTTQSSVCSQVNGSTSSLLPYVQFGSCATDPSNYSYQWSVNPPSTGGIISAANVDSVQVIANNSSARYSVTISDTLLACSETIDTTISIIAKYNTKPDSLAPICANDGFVNLTAPTPANVTSPGGSWSGAGITNSQQGRWDVSQSGAGTFMVYYEITGNSCASKDSIEITIHNLPFGGIHPIDYLCGNEGNVPEHRLIGITPGGYFAGVGINIDQNGQFWIDGTRYNPTVLTPDTALIRHVVRVNSCTNDTLLKIPVRAPWDSTYLGVLSNGTPIFTNEFCATTGPDTLVVAGADAAWRLDGGPFNQEGMLDTSAGIIDFRLVNSGRGGQVAIIAEKKGFCGGIKTIQASITAPPEVKILTEDFCFNKPGDCAASGVPANEQTKKILVRVAKFPFRDINDANPSSYVDVVTATKPQTQWPNLIESNSFTKWDGSPWMGFSNKCEASFCSLPVGKYPVRYQLGMGYRSGLQNSDTICYSYDTSALNISDKINLQLTAEGDLCKNSLVNIQAQPTGSGYGFEWSTGETTDNIDVTDQGVYAVTIKQSYCESMDSISVSFCSSLVEIESGFKAKVYPNPARDRIFVSIEEPFSQARLNVTNASAQQVADYDLISKHEGLIVELDVREWSQGVYFFKLISGAKVETFKVIVD